MRTLGAIVVVGGGFVVVVVVGIGVSVVDVGTVVELEGGEEVVVGAVDVETDVVDVTVVVDVVLDDVVGGAVEVASDVGGAVVTVVDPTGWLTLSASAVEAATGFRGSETSSRTTATAWVAIHTDNTLAASHAVMLSFFIVAPCPAAPVGHYPNTMPALGSLTAN